MQVVTDTQLLTSPGALNLRFRAEISKPFGVLDTVLEWCREHLQSEWRWTLTQPSTNLFPGQYEFYFADEHDYLVFVLRWT